ncbi:MAG: aminotransferase class I/II-fold pyridoxal phosphate-dependent enzyme [Bacteroidales bacterium]|nr:aminotransferase class I/II-fold pyridoxal phosphate-dependent enzyme [Bacteroidales bacterium]
MAKYNFDKELNRMGTSCIKWDMTQKIWGKKNLLPMWIADMDFATPKFFTDALVKRVDGGVLGYGCRPQKWYDAIKAWFKHRYNWEITDDQIGFVPGIVVGIAHALRCFTKPGDKVLIFPPVYFPFANQIAYAGCKEVDCPLVLKEGKNGEDFEIDFSLLEKRIKGCKAMILCNPHNPGGRVWTKAELQKIARICLDNKVFVISDEIHCDLSFKGHIPFATVNAKQAQNTITFHAPSKTFNCAGVGASEWVAVNREMHDKFAAYLRGGEFDGGHYDSFMPSSIFYSPKGEEWLSQALDYIKANIDYVEQFLKDNFTVDTIEFSGKKLRMSSEDKEGNAEEYAEAKISRSQLIRMIRPQASFLIFLDFRRLGLSQKELVDFVVDKAHLALNDGAMFGVGGEGFMRLNVGCPRKTMERAMTQLKAAFDKKYKL